MLKRLAYILLLMFFARATYAQNKDDEIQFFRLNSISGEAGIKGYYRDQHSVTSGNTDYDIGKALSGLLLINTNSFILNKKFLILDVNGEINPETSNNNYLVMPNLAEVRTLGRLNVSALFFSEKPVSLTLFVNRESGYSNRENLTNLKTNTKMYGGLLTFANKVLPGSISYNQSSSLVEESPGGRLYSIEDKNFLATANKSFSPRDRNMFSYSHDNYWSQQMDLNPMNVILDNLSLSDNVYLDKKQRYIFNSYISTLRQTRTVTMKRMEVTESLNCALPHNVNMMANYSLFKYEQLQTKSTQQVINYSAYHRLYKSLTTGVEFEYMDTKQTFFHETKIQGGFDVTYQKKLPANGLLTMGYRYELQNQKQVSAPVQIQIFNEEHILTDGKITLLDKAYAVLPSIVVTNPAGTIIYAINLDYILIARNNFVEIQRMPGGQIANNAIVLVSYLATLPGSYQFDRIGNYASASISLFNNIVEFYYRYMNQDYQNLKQTEYVTLNYVKQNFYGVKVQYKFASGGIEYDDYNSNIIPYKMTRYFFMLQGNYRDKIMYSLMGNKRDYNMVADHLIQKYTDVAGNLGYQVNMNSRLNVDLTYRFQQGAGIDLKLFTSRIEYLTSYRRLYFIASVDFYNVIYIGQTLNFKGASLQITRRF